MYKDKEVKQILRLATELTHYTIEYDVSQDRVRGKLTLVMHHATLKQVFDLVLKPLGLTAQFLPDHKVRIVERKP